MGDVQVDSKMTPYAPLNNPNENPQATAIPVGAEQHWACAFVSTRWRTVGNVQVDSGQLLYAPLKDSKEYPSCYRYSKHRTAFGNGKRNAFLTRRCSRRITLAFLPFAFRVAFMSNVPIRAGKRARG